MKKLLLLLLISFISLNVNAQFQDDMEYEPGNPIGSWWGCAPPPPSPFCIGINTDQAHSGLRSGSIPGDGTTDVILDLGNKIFDIWCFSFWMYVPSNKEAYWNLQGVVPIGAGEWIVGNIFFNQDNSNPGVGLIDDSALGPVNFNFPHDEWFRIIMTWDISTGIALATWEFWVGSEEVIPYGTPFTNQAGDIPTSLGGMDFFSISTDNLYYFDDFLFFSTINNESCSFPLGVVDDKEVGFSVYPNPVKDILIIDNRSNSYITSINIYDVLGSLVLTEKGDVEQIDVSHLDSGLLFMEIETDQGVITKKIIKE